MSYREIAAACISCGLHLALGASAWRMQDDAFTRMSWERERSLPLVAYIYTSPRPSPETSSMLASFTPDHFTTAIDVGSLPNLDAVASDSAEAARETRSPADYAEVERLQGLYRGQLFARLQRVLYELGPLEERRDVPCTLNVIQRTDGSVVDVMTDLCSYSQKSLLLLRNALDAASPLPLPPSGLAVGTYLNLDISAYLASE